MLSINVIKHYTTHFYILQYKLENFRYFIKSVVKKWIWTEHFIKVSRISSRSNIRLIQMFDCKLYVTAGFAYVGLFIWYQVSIIITYNTKSAHDYLLSPGVNFKGVGQEIVIDLLISLGFVCFVTISFLSNIRVSIFR